jgi:hypothetical protein
MKKSHDAHTPENRRDTPGGATPGIEKALALLALPVIALFLVKSTITPSMCQQYFNQCPLTPQSF